MSDPKVMLKSEFAKKMGFRKDNLILVDSDERQIKSKCSSCLGPAGNQVKLSGAGKLGIGPGKLIVCVAMKGPMIRLWLFLGQS